MKYRLTERGNPRDLTAPKKWYATPVNHGKVTMKDFSKEIAGRSSLTRGDIDSVLSNFLDELPTFLKLGHSVQLGNFGTLRLSFSSEGVETPEEFSARLIDKVKVIFTPSPDMKASMDGLKFEKELKSKQTEPEQP